MEDGKKNSAEAFRETRGVPLERSLRQCEVWQAPEAWEEEEERREWEAAERARGREAFGDG